MTNREEILFDLLNRMLIDVKVVTKDINLSDLDIVAMTEMYLEHQAIRANVLKLWRGSSQFDYQYPQAKNYVIKQLMKIHNIPIEQATQYFCDVIED